jgi:hypothetical protein
MVLFDDRVDGAVADLDAASLQVCFDDFTAPAFTPPNLYDSGDGFLWQSVDDAWSPRLVDQPRPSFPLEADPPIMNCTLGHHSVG